MSQHSVRFSICLMALVFSYYATAKSDGKVVVGFAQLGAESEWRVANTISIKAAADEAGVVLKFADAMQKQENQIKAIRTFILQKVDVIAFPPIVSTGWREVLLEAKKAKIPVIVTDREIDEKDSDLYMSFLGADFVEEGRRAAKCLLNEDKKQGRTGTVNIIELRGTDGASAATGRKVGFREGLKGHPNYKVVRSETADFREAMGKEIMEKILKESKAQKRSIQAIYAHNDSMALGAIPALEAVGLKPGKDVTLVSIDGIKSAFLAMKDGKLNCSVECSPLFGPQLMKIAKEAAEGKVFPKRILTEEGVFPASTAEAELPNRKY